jgi:NADH:ubiquinone oxidoreductase subunit 6 (subunit J)
VSAAFLAAAAFYIELAAFTAWALDALTWLGALRLLLVAACMGLQAEHQGRTDDR